mmetsp:Transcript_1707/g.5068  ORF Transcript_1707/g.5068 Transcript_1707/m.5068 type:complete len:217 (-) Transcript_1707:62-712(-)
MGAALARRFGNARLKRLALRPEGYIELRELRAERVAQHPDARIRRGVEGCVGLELLLREPCGLGGLRLLRRQGLLQLVLRRGGLRTERRSGLGMLRRHRFELRGVVVEGLLRRRLVASEVGLVPGRGGVRPRGVNVQRLRLLPERGAGGILMLCELSRRLGLVGDQQVRHLLDGKPKLLLVLVQGSCCVCLVRTELRGMLLEGRRRRGFVLVEALS